jgi:DNA polymerase-3 subunit alpha
VFFLKSSFGREEGRSRFGRGSSDFGSRQHSDEDIPDIAVSDEGGLEDEIIEEITIKAEPKGNFNFLNLDEVEAFKDLAFPPKNCRIVRRKRAERSPKRKR